MYCIWCIGPERRKLPLISTLKKAQTTIKCCDSSPPTPAGEEPIPTHPNMKLYNHISRSRVDYFNLSDSHENLRRSAVRGAGLTIFSQASNYIIQMFSTVVLARLVTPNHFGLVAMVSAIYIFFMMFRNFGLNEAVIQAPDIDHKKISTLFWINIVVSFVLTLIFIAIAPVLAWFYKEPRLISITATLSLVFIFGGLSTQHVALLKRQMSFFSISINEILAALLSTTTAIILAIYGWGYWALIWRQLILAISSAVGAWILCKWRPGWPARGTGVRPMIKFGINTLGTNTINYMSQNLDKILIGWKFGALPLGYYDRAYHLFMAPAQQLTWPLGSVALSTLSKLQHDSEKFSRYILKALSILAFIGLPISACLTLTSKDIILLLLGPQWDEAAKIFSILGTGIGIIILYGTHAWIHASLGRTDRWLKWSIVNSIITIGFIGIGLRYGSIGVAVAYTLSLYILLGPSLLYAVKPINVKLSTIVNVVWRYFVSALLAAVVVHYFLQYLDSSRIDLLIRLIGTVIFYLIVYILMVIISHWGIKPIKLFGSVLRDFYPN